MEVTCGATGDELVLFHHTGILSELMVYNYFSFTGNPIAVTGALIGVSFSVETEHTFQPNTFIGETWLSF